MIIHSPIFSGSINQAESAYANLSGSFTGSFTGIGNFEGLEADSVAYDNVTGKPTLVSGSSQVSYPDLSNIPSGIISSSAQLSADFLDTLGDGVISGSSQIQFNDINNNPFSQSASSVTVSKNIIPTTNTIDLGSPEVPFRDLYLSSASLYINGTQVISTENGDLNITTDANQSLRIVEEGADTITLQTENGDITLTATGNGVIELDAPIQIAAGNQILSSDGNAIQIGEDISVTGNIAVTGTVDGVDVAALKASFDTLNGKSVVSGSSQVSYPDLSNIPSGIVSGSSQVVLNDANKTGFDTADVVEGTNLYYTDARVKTKLDAETVVSGSSQILTLVSIDEDTMTSNSDTKLPTQQSVKAYVDSKVSALVDSAPSTLDTLNELAAALGDDANFSTTLSNQVGGKVSQSLQIISGNGLTGGGNLTTDRTLNVVGTADRISVSADAVDIASTYVGQTSITTLGTIGTGTWQGSVIASAYLDADTAHLSGTQTFTGAKTFSAAVNISDSTASTTKTTGALIVTGGVGVSGALNVGGDVVAYASSDKRLKDNIKNIENPIEKVQKLNGVTWDWNSNADELQQSLPNVGVIAQEVEEVFPQLVHNRDNGFKGVDYAKLTGLLIEAIKEQQKQIDELKSKLQ